MNAIKFCLLVLICTACGDVSAAMIIDESGWSLVRRVGPGGTWHPATDSLAGTDVYGTPVAETASGTFSIDFESAVPGYDQLLFITGDRTRWLVMTKSEVAKPAANDPLQIIASYLDSSPHTRLMFNRAGFPEDPWLSALDHFDAIGTGNILYGESSFGGSHASTVLPVFNGANVFIRNSSTAAVPEPSTLVVLGPLAAFAIARRRRRN